MSKKKSNNNANKPDKLNNTNNTNNINNTTDSSIQPDTPTRGETGSTTDTGNARNKEKAEKNDKNGKTGKDDGKEKTGNTTDTSKTADNGNNKNKEKTGNGRTKKKIDWNCLVKESGKKVGLLGLSAVLIYLAHPLPDLGWLAWIGLIPALIATEGTGFKKGLLWGWALGLSVFLSTGTWFLIFGWEPWLGGNLYWSFFWALFFGVWGWITTLYPAGAWQRLVISPFIWIFMEWVKSQGPIGYDWAIMGLTQHDFLALMQVSSLAGVYGVSFILVLVNVLIAETILFCRTGSPAFIPGEGGENRLQEKPPTTATATEEGDRLREKPPTSAPTPTGGGWIGVLKSIFDKDSSHPQLRNGWALTLVLLPTLLLWGQFSIPVMDYQDEEGLGKGVRIGVVQPNIPQDKKWDPDYFQPTLDMLEEGTQKLSRSGCELVIWPETAIPDINPLKKKRITRYIKRVVEENNVYLLTGVITWDKKHEEMYNSAILVFPDGNIDSPPYNKNLLVPFAEYLPLPESFRKYAIFGRTSNYTPSKEHKVFDSPYGKFSVLICFESMFCGLARQNVKDGAQFLIAITNDAWFERTNMAKIHFIMSKFRAVENRVWMIQCANTGISGTVDPWGRITHQTPMWERLEFQKSIYVRNYGHTLYTMLGDWLPVGGGLFSIIFLVYNLVIIKNR